MNSMNNMIPPMLARQHTASVVIPINRLLMAGRNPWPYRQLKMIDVTAANPNTRSA